MSARRYFLWVYSLGDKTTGERCGHDFIGDAVTELDQEWDYPGPHIVQAHVQAADIDGLHHTNNLVYVDWCQRAAWAHSEAVGLNLDCYRALDRAMVITHSELDYLRASQEGDEVMVATWIVEWDKKLTMARHFQVVRIADGITLLRARMRFVCVELSSGRPRRLPPEFIAHYGPAVLNGGGA